MDSGGPRRGDKVGRGNLVNGLVENGLRTHNLKKVAVKWEGGKAVDTSRDCTQERTGSDSSFCGVTFYLGEKCEIPE